MAYFSNGSEGMVFDDECDGCLAFNGCPIALVHAVYNYDQVGNKDLRDAMNLLVAEKDGEYLGCQMKKIIDKELI